MLQGEFGLDLVPLDDDVLSLELDRAFRCGGVQGLAPMWGLGRAALKVL
jgi:hypothetical protein